MSQSRARFKGPQTTTIHSASLLAPQSLFKHAGLEMNSRRLSSVQWRYLKSLSTSRVSKVWPGPKCHVARFWARDCFHKWMDRIPILHNGCIYCYYSQSTDGGSRYARLCEALSGRFKALHPFVTGVCPDAPTNVSSYSISIREHRFLW